MVAIIPARGGSKGLPGKNIKTLCGKPLIAYTIEAAQNSKLIDKVIVSTDSQEIASVATKYGAEVPFMRPGELATDDAKARDVFLYTVERTNCECGYGISDFVVLQPTSPLRTAQDIDNAIKIYKENNADVVVSVRESEHPPEWYKTITNSGQLKDYIKSSNILNRQEYEKTYIPNGAIYIFNHTKLKENPNYYESNVFPYIMTREASVDIDTMLDFNMAELIIKARR